jgi:flavin reductase ActVB
LKAGAAFIIHFLAADQVDLARRFATFLPEKFEGLDYRVSRRGCPQLEGVLAYLECVADSYHPGGDHTILVGKVLDARLANTHKEPLVYFQGKYRIGDIGKAQPERDPSPQAC